MSDWQKFFKSNEDYRVEVFFYENRDSFTVEEMYQAFKARLQQELMVDTHGTSNYGVLVERNEPAP